MITFVAVTLRITVVLAIGNVQVASRVQQPQPPKVVKPHSYFGGRSAITGVSRGVEISPRTSKMFPVDAVTPADYIIARIRDIHIARAIEETALEGFRQC